MSGTRAAVLLSGMSGQTQTAPSTPFAAEWRTQRGYDRTLQPRTSARTVKVVRGCAGRVLCERVEAGGLVQGFAGQRHWTR